MTVVSVPHTDANVGGNFSDIDQVRLEKDRKFWYKATAEVEQDEILPRGQRRVMQVLWTYCKGYGYCCKNKYNIKKIASILRLKYETVKRYIAQLIKRGCVLDVIDYKDRRYLVAHESRVRMDATLDRFQKESEREDRYQSALAKARTADASPKVAKPNDQAPIPNTDRSHTLVGQNLAPDAEYHAPNPTQTCVEAGKIFRDAEMGIEGGINPESIVNDSITDSIFTVTYKADVLLSNNFFNGMAEQHTDILEKSSASARDGAPANPAENDNVPLGNDSPPRPAEDENRPVLSDDARALLIAAQRIESALVITHSTVRKMIDAWHSAGDTDSEIALTLTQSLAVVMAKKDLGNRVGYWRTTANNMASESRHLAKQHAQAEADGVRRKQAALAAVADIEDLEVIRDRYNALWVHDPTTGKFVDSMGWQIASQNPGWSQKGLSQRKEAAAPFVLKAFLLWESGNLQMPAPETAPDQPNPAASVPEATAAPIVIESEQSMYAPKHGVPPLTQAKRDRLAAWTALADADKQPWYTRAKQEFDDCGVDASDWEKLTGRAKNLYMMG